MNIGNALQALGITEWVLRGEPASEAEFNAMFRKVTGAAQTAYRQALRDITETYTSLDDVVWPEVPNE